MADESILVKPNHYKHTQYKMEKIFIGVPILNRLDLLEKCIGAVDHLAEIIIINNNSTDSDFKERLDGFASAMGLTVLHQARNLGVSASWNLLIRTGFAKGYEWIFIGSNDTFLQPGSLKAACDCKKDEDVGVWHLCGFNFFLLNRRTIDSIGWFDENFYPAYNEDIDYKYRCKLARMRVVHIDGAGGEHVGSATINSNPDYFASNKETHRKNSDYYRSKWGGDCSHERFVRPYNNPEYDHTWWPVPGESVIVRDWDNRYRTKGVA
jgi:GT2 family glycosyltransferase